MKAKAFRRERARVEGYITRWQTNVGLGYWRIDRCYYQTAAQFHEATGERAEDSTLMLVRPDWRYLQCTLHVNCEATAQCGDWYLEQDVVHELVHCHLDELRWAVGDGDGEVSDELHNHIEHVTETVAKALVWVRDDIAKNAGGMPAEQGQRDAGRGVA